MKSSVTERLPSVSIRELSRSPGEVLNRVVAGERLLVSRNGKPIATLQPLDGYVFQPFTGVALDVFGWPMGGIDEEIAKLTLAQRVLLRDCYSHWRLWPGRLPEHLLERPRAMLRDFELRGLARKTECGWELTGRGLALHEALQGREL